MEDETRDIAVPFVRMDGKIYPLTFEAKKGCARAGQGKAKERPRVAGATLEHLSCGQCCKMT
jgi:hypothetical protein